MEHLNEIAAQVKEDFDGVHITLARAYVHSRPHVVAAWAVTAERIGSGEVERWISTREDVVRWLQERIDYLAKNREVIYRMMLDAHDLEWDANPEIS